MQDIDFVMPWVDGSDPAWQAQREQYDPAAKDRQKDACRFRDWDNLQYWFRAVEEFAPWVRRVHFITWGHLPPWLNTGHPKLHIVRHEDYIPAEYLPTFNSHTIELNMHRIDGLAEQFVYFNDDTFLTKAVQPNDFFKNGLPRDILAHNMLTFGKNGIWNIIARDAEVINSHFHIRDCQKEHFYKWFSPVYGKQLIRTILLLPWRELSYFYIPHLPVPYLKNTLEEVWKAETKLLDETCRSRFRDFRNVNQYLFRFWRLAKGEFMPTSPKIGRTYSVRDANVQIVCHSILKQSWKMLCINDNEENTDFKNSSLQIKDALNSILPLKCSYER